MRDALILVLFCFVCYPRLLGEQLPVGQASAGARPFDVPTLQTEEGLAKFGRVTAPSRSRLGKIFPFNEQFPSRAREQAVSSSFASSSEGCLGSGKRSVNLPQPLQSSSQQIQRHLHGKHADALAIAQKPPVDHHRALGARNPDVH